MRMQRSAGFSSNPSMHGGPLHRAILQVVVSRDGRAFQMYGCISIPLSTFDAMCRWIEGSRTHPRHGLPEGRGGGKPELKVVRASSRLKHLPRWTLSGKRYIVADPHSPTGAQSRHLAVERASAPRSLLPMNTLTSCVLLQESWLATLLPRSYGSCSSLRSPSRLTAQYNCTTPGPRPRPKLVAPPLPVTVSDLDEELHRIVLIYTDPYGLFDQIYRQVISQGRPNPGQAYVLPRLNEC